MYCKYEPVSKQDKGWEEKRKGEKRIEKNQKSDIVDKNLPRKIKYYHKPQPMQKMTEKETKIKFCFHTTQHQFIPNYLSNHNCELYK